MDLLLALGFVGLIGMVMAAVGILVGRWLAPQVERLTDEKEPDDDE